MLERAVSLCSREGNLKIPDNVWVRYKVKVVKSAAKKVIDDEETES